MVCRWSTLFADGGLHGLSMVPFFAGCLPMVPFFRGWLVHGLDLFADGLTLFADGLTLFADD